MTTTSRAEQFKAVQGRVGQPHRRHEDLDGRAPDNTRHESRTVDGVDADMCSHGLVCDARSFSSGGGTLSRGLCGAEGRVEEVKLMVIDTAQ